MCCVIPNISLHLHMHMCDEIINKTCEILKNFLVKMVEQENIRLVMVNAGSEINCRTFVFKKEGHTLGNALRSAILQNPQVEFCGYSMPHPAEDQMHMRIQTVKGVDAQDALLKGLQDLKAMSVHAKETFEKSVKKAKN